ncbi:MAG: nucleotide exchange factor GrpE [Patescibacteria group bacterium]
MDDENIELIDESIEEQIKKLKERLKICQKEKGEYLDGWQRAKADFINARRDEEKRIENYTRYAKAEILNEFLTLADTIDIAQKHTKSEEIIPVYQQLADILKKQGVQPIACVGQAFNPELHEAIMQTEVESEDEDNIIAEEIQKGYMIADRVLRPSKVKVGILKIKN